LNRILIQNINPNRFNSGSQIASFLGCFFFDQGRDLYTLNGIELVCVCCIGLVASVTTMVVTRNTPDPILTQYMADLLKIWACACKKTFDCTSVLLPQCEDFISRIGTIRTMTSQQQQILVDE